MEKILNTKGLGVSGRQNELIELALTYKFSTVEVDMDDLIGRHDTMGKEFACQFLQSAKVNIGTFDLPINLDANDEEFNKACEKLDTIFSLSETLGAKRCRVTIATSSDEPFQSNFERHRTRLFDLGDKFASHDMRLGVALQLPSKNEKDNKFIQTAEELLTLVKTVGHANIGLYLDTWHWKASGGAMDQISELDPSKVTELAMADLSESADPGNISLSDRALPGDYDGSFSINVCNQLKSQGYAGPISFATHLSTYSNVNRESIVNRISKRLDCLISGESFDTIDERPISTLFEEQYAKEHGDRRGGGDTNAEKKPAEAEKKSAEEKTANASA